MPDGQPPRVVRCDYDTDPGRFAATLAFRARSGPGRAGSDVFGTVAPRIIDGDAPGPVLELGGGSGPLARELAGRSVCPAVVADLAEGLLSQAPRPAVRTDARTFVACTPSRCNDPELAAVLPGWGRPLTFDAENAAQQVGQFFEITETQTWDVPLLALGTRGEVEHYLRGRGLSGQAASRAAGRVRVPVRLTKRGTLIWARKAA